MIKIKLKKIVWLSLILFLGLSLTLNIGASAAANQTNTNTTNHTPTQYTTNSTYGEGDVTTNTTIKVLIYNGAYSIASCVNGIKTALATANTNNLAPGYNFTYSTTTVINTASLSGYDLLVMPGGNSGYNYIYSSSISSSAIKNFISSGNGYIGICAGAYSGTKAVDGHYTAWGLADVRSTHPYHEGLLNVSITTAGQELLGYTGTITMAHYNGPAFYASGGDIITFATYADNIIKSQGMAAIIGDYYGKGRTVLSGPHPELAPQYPDIVAKLIIWAANVSITPTPDPTPTNMVTMNQLGTAANTVKTFYENNQKLPSSVTINNKQVSIPSFLYLLAQGTVQANTGSTADILLKNVESSTSISGTIKSGNILKTEYISNAQNIISFIDTFGKTPNYITTSLGNMSFDATVYTYSRIMSFYKTNSRLPNYVAFTASGSTTPITTATMSQISTAAVTVKSYYETNKNLPSLVTINNQQLSMSTFLNLLTTATIQANSGSTAAITIQNVQSATNPSGTIQSGNLLKSEYINIAQNIKTYIANNNIAPNNVNTSLGNLSFDKAVYLFSKIMNFFKTNSRLPNYVSMS